MLELSIDTFKLSLRDHAIVRMFWICDGLIMGTRSSQILDGMATFECMFRLSVYFSCESWLLRFSFCGNWSRREQKLLYLRLKRRDLSFLCINFSFKHSNSFIFFFLTVKEVLLILF